MDQQYGQPNQGEQQNQAYQQQPPQYNNQYGAQNNAQYTPQYNPQFQYQYGAADLDKPMTVGQYLVMLLIGIIPVAGIIMWFVWAFGSNVNTNKRNFARAYLIFALISVALSIILTIAFSAVIMGMIAAMGGYGGYGY